MIAVLFPFKKELEFFLQGKEGWLAKPSLDLQIWTHPDHSGWVFCVSGQGKVETALSAQILSGKAAVDFWILAGSAVALKGSLKSGDILLGTQSIEWDFVSDPEASPNQRPRFDARRTWQKTDWSKNLSLGAEEDVILSGDRSVFLPEEKRQLGELYGASALAWEGAGFFRFLRRTKAPGMEIRLISESVAENKLPMDVFLERIKTGMPRLREILFKMVNG